MNRPDDPLLQLIGAPELTGLLRALAGSGLLVLQLLDREGRLCWFNRPLLPEGAEPAAGSLLTDRLAQADAVRMGRYLQGEPLPDDWFLLNVLHENQMPATLRCRMLAVGAYLLLLAEPILEGRQALQEELLELVNQSTMLSRESARKSRELARTLVELQHTQAELLHYQNELEGLVRERTAELEVARDAAEAASRAKSIFIANMSHELRTPLNAVIGQAHLLRRNVGPDQRQGLETILASSQQLLGIINGLIDMARIDSGRLTQEKRQFATEQLLREVCTPSAAAAAGKGLLLSWENGLPPALHGDGARLCQLLQQLVDNGVKFTEQGQVLLEARVLEQNGEQITARFCVSDTGCGLSPDEQERLFQPFEQLDGSSTRRHGGIGMGLALARQLAGLLEGSMGLESCPGCGSRFWVDLPLTVGDPAALPQPEILAGEDQDSQTAAGTTAGEVEPAALEERLAALRSLLAADDLQAARLYQQLQPYFEAVYGAAAAGLGRLIAGYALDEALHELDRLVRRTDDPDE